MNLESKALERMIEEGGALMVLDVRSRFEYASGHVAGAEHVPFWKVPFVAPKIVPDKQTRIVVYCEHGPRAVLARTMLQLSGYENVSMLKGHMHGWRREGRKMES